mmetsp:Transcript_27127/g.43570  ORF Transcript_27127/g.43570 Transcript_27127/m.43570 type:complete len:265 (+) Transcript_27127:400-1194(+)
MRSFYVYSISSCTGSACIPFHLTIVWDKVCAVFGLLDCSSRVRQHPGFTIFLWFKEKVQPISAKGLSLLNTLETFGSVMLGPASNSYKSFGNQMIKPSNALLEFTRPIIDVRLWVKLEPKKWKVLSFVYSNKLSVVFCMRCTNNFECVMECLVCFKYIRRKPKEMVVVGVIGTFQLLEEPSHCSTSSKPEFAGRFLECHWQFLFASFQWAHHICFGDDVCHALHAVANTNYWNWFSLLCRLNRPINHSPYRWFELWSRVPSARQ